MTLPESWSIAHVRIHVGPRRRRAFHEEELAGGAVRIPLHHHRAVADVRQQHGRDVGVVLNQVALGDAAAPARTACAGWSAGPRAAPTVSVTLSVSVGSVSMDLGHLGAPSASRRIPGSAPASAGAARVAPRRQRDVFELDPAPSTQRSISPPRLMSPRPTKPAETRSRSPKIGSSTSTYLPDAMLPSSTTSHSGPTASSSARRACSSGRRYAALPRSIDRRGERPERRRA